MKSIIAVILFPLCLVTDFLVATTEVTKFGFHEASFQASGSYANPYTDLEAVADVEIPDGTIIALPLFWDGGKIWRLRISPNTTGKWSYAIRSKDEGLDGKKGAFDCVDSALGGSLQVMEGYPHHFQKQDGSPFLFWGDTAWSLFLNNKEESLSRETVFCYIDKRAREGINVVHSMLLSEAGWGNQGGDPFINIAHEKLNPGYWQEVDLRLQYLNSSGIIGGLALAWGEKGHDEPWSWSRFTTMEAKKRYARYVAARFSAYNVYFLVSGEWNSTNDNRESLRRKEIKAEFIKIGEILEEADIHDRMIGMHPRTVDGRVSEFNVADWMSFGDYQQNYDKVHQSVVEARSLNKPVVNAEHGYYLRDSSFDGKVDKHNSFTPQDMRYTTWDILMGGAYPITGYGTTYMGGYRDPGPFNPDDPRNLVWTAQYHLARHFFQNIKWWRLEPKDEWISVAESRSFDRGIRVHIGNGRSRIVWRPPLTSYWLLAESGRLYVAYGRGVNHEVTIHLGDGNRGQYKGVYYNPRTGVEEELGAMNVVDNNVRWKPPVYDDWVLTLSRVK